MAQLYVYGHDLDFRTLFPREVQGPVSPDEFADIPPTRFLRKPHWLDAHFSGDGTGVMPGIARRDAGRPARLRVRAARRRAPTWPRW